MNTTQVPPLLLAADSGGTKTRFLLLTAAGETVAETETPGVAALRPGLLPVAASLQAGIAALPVAPARITDCYFSLGGPNVAEVEATLRALLPAARITVDREANGNLILAAGKFLHCRAAVLIGTGSTAVGEYGQRRHFAGGWGPALDDAGSGGKLGMEALRIYLRYLDGRADAGRLPALFEALEAGTDQRTFPGRMTVKERANALSRQELAKLAPAIFRLAETGDAVAATLIGQTAVEIAELAAAVTPPEPEPGAERILALGGLFRSGEKFRGLCAEELRRLRPRHHWYPPEHFDLARGAALMVLLQAGAAVDECFFNRNLKG